jgi:hypothetical protein
MKQTRGRAAVVIISVVMAAVPRLGSASALDYQCSFPPLDVTFVVKGGYYNGAVNCGNLFLQTDIPTAPVVRWRRSNPGKFYTLMMLDLDGNAKGSWPDAVVPGRNAPVRHWIVGNIPGDVLAGTGYVEAASTSGQMIAVLQSYRQPQIPLVSDRYDLYLFQQEQKIEFAALSGPVTNFDYAGFLEEYHLRRPEASNFFVAMYTSQSPFSGKAFQGNDVSGAWHQGYGTGKLAPFQ